MRDDDLVKRIRGMVADSPLHVEADRKVWARLRHTGVRTSKERVRRLMRANDLAVIPEDVDQRWGTDMTAAVKTREGRAAVFIAIDRFTTECFGIHAAKRGTRLEALEPVRQGVRARFGAIGKDVATCVSASDAAARCSCRWRIRRVMPTRL
jgi:hypothetical protein